jgi:chorismate synthase
MGRLRFLTAGESHGPALAATLEGVPAGLPLTADQIALDLVRRQRGYGRGARSTSIEQDRAEILAGVRHGLTIGSPILLLIRNRDWENWTRVMQVEPLTDEQAAELAALAEAGDKRATPITRLRAGHADLAGCHQVRFGRRPQHPGARLRARDRRPGRGRSGGAGAPGNTGYRRLVAHGRGRRRGDGRSPATPLARVKRRRRARCAARTPRRRRAWSPAWTKPARPGDTVGGVFEVVARACRWAWAATSTGTAASTRPWPARSRASRS